MVPVFEKKSKNVKPTAVPMMMFGGSPAIVAAPPRLAQKTSARTMGMGSNFRSRDSSTVTAARNRMTVILPMNMLRNAEISIKTMNSGISL